MGEVIAETSRTRALRACGIAERGLDASFDRLARLAVGATRAPVCIITFGDDPRVLVKGYAGPESVSLADVLPSRSFYAALLEKNPPSAEASGDVAAAVILAAGVPAGAVCVRTLVRRTWTRDALDALTEIAHLAGNELVIRAGRQPSEAIATILERISDACVFLDRDWRYTYLNRKAGEIFGRDPKRLVGRHIWTEFPEGVGQKFYHAYHKAVREQAFEQLEEYYPPYNRWFENRIYPTPDGLAIFFQDVTERRRQELERRRLATILETTTDLVAVSDAEGALLFLNRAGRTLLGVADGADLKNVHLVRMHALSSRDSLCDALPIAVEKGSWSGEATVVAAGGAERELTELILWHPAPPPEGGYYSLVARDVTDRKLAEAQRQRDAEVRTQAERMAHLGQWVWNVPQNRITWSAELSVIFGLTPDEAASDASFDDYLERVHPQDRARARESIELALRDREPFAFTARIVRPGGEVRHLRSWGKASVDASGQPAQMFGACLDVTEVLLATEGLERTEEWLGAALRNTRVAVWEWNVRTNDVEWSHDAATVLGLGPDDLATSFDAYLEHVHPDDREAVFEALRAAVDRGGDLDVEHRLLVPGGTERWVVARARASRDESGRVVRLLGTLVDVTERRRNEDERRQLVERLGHAQKMEGIGRLAAGVAHDFNNHLTIVQGAVDLLLHEPGLSASALECVASIQSAAESAGALTKHLLGFGRHRRSDAVPARMDLNDVVLGACRLLQRLLPDDVKLTLSLASTLDAVRGDREQIERVLLNLIVNARDAMPRGGQLEIRTREEGDHAALEISDTGVGMAPDVQARIFEPFFTTKTEGQGTGLGLATVYGIVTRSGGSIDVTSQPGTGSRFTVRLPFAEPRGQATADGRTTSPRAERSGVS
jgi:PAS domain S-box-containing protein